MTTFDIPNPLGETLARFFNVNALAPDAAARALRVLEDGGTANVTVFRQQLAEAITARSITPATYEALTSSGAETLDEVVDELAEIWTDMFPDQPLPRR
jgi:hypothetical protein